MFPLYTNRWELAAPTKRRRFTPEELKLIEEREAYARRCRDLAEQHAGTARGDKYEAEARKWEMAARDARSGNFQPVK